MYAAAELAGAGGQGAVSSRTRQAARSERALGPAMRLMLTLAVARANGDGSPRSGQTIQALWDLAERYHPEQAWLAASWLRKERTMDELERCAPREGLAPGLRAVFGPGVSGAQDLRFRRVLAQE